MSGQDIQPGSVWFVDFDPVQGREQGKDRPALVVSSRFHLDVTRGSLATVLPMTRVDRPGWGHRLFVAAAGGWVLTEQVRTLTTSRFRRELPDFMLTDDELVRVRRLLADMLFL